MSHRFIRAYSAAYAHFIRSGSSVAFHTALYRYNKSGYLKGVTPCNVHPKGCGH